MIYFDNAATTAVKPPEVAEGGWRGRQQLRGVGRGVHGRRSTRAMPCSGAPAAGRLFGAADPSCVSFASNATEALNTAIAGLARPGTSW